MSLGDLLRTNLDAYSVHFGCEQGVCGACTVLLDGETVRSCLLLAAQAEGRRVTTAEGVPARRKEQWAEIESTFLSMGAFQCGFCTSGMIICLEELLDRGVPFKAPQLASHLSGQICRCTGYAPILQAFEAVLEEAHLLTKESP